MCYRDERAPLSRLVRHKENLIAVASATIVHAAMSEPIEISSSSSDPAPRPAPQCPLCYEPMRSCYVRVPCGHAVCVLCEGNLEHRRMDDKCPCCNTASANQVFVQDAGNGCEVCGAFEDASVTSCGHVMCVDCGAQCLCARRGAAVGRAHLNAKVA